MVYFWSEVGIISEKFANDVKEDLMKYFISLFFLIISQEIVAGAFAGDTIIYTENGLKQAEDIEVGDSLLTCFHEIGRCEFIPIKDISKSYRASFRLKTNQGSLILKGDEKVLANGTWSSTSKSSGQFLDFYESEHVNPLENESKKLYLAAVKFSGYKHLYTFTLDRAFLPKQLIETSDADLKKNTSLYIKMNHSMISLSSALAFSKSSLSEESKKDSFLDSSFLDLCLNCKESGSQACSREAQHTIATLNRMYAMNDSTIHTPLDQFERRHFEDLHEDLSFLIAVDLRGKNISDLTPLTGFHNLEVVYLSNNQVKDLSPIANLSNLKELHCEGNPIGDFSSLISRNIEIFVDPMQYQQIKESIHLESAEFALEVVGKKQKSLATDEKPRDHRIFQLIQDGQFSEVEKLIKHSTLNIFSLKNSKKQNPIEFSYVQDQTAITDLLINNRFSSADFKTVTIDPSFL